MDKRIDAAYREIEKSYGRLLELRRLAGRKRTAVRTRIVEELAASFGSGMSAELAACVALAHPLMLAMAGEAGEILAAYVQRPIEARG